MSGLKTRKPRLRWRFPISRFHGSTGVRSGMGVTWGWRVVDGRQVIEGVGDTGRVDFVGKGVTGRWQFLESASR